MKLLETEWMTYRNKVLPKNAGEVQITESRRAFFGGAWAIYALMMNALEEGTEATPADVRLMEKLHNEMVEFHNRMVKGHA